MSQNGDPELKINKKGLGKLKGAGSRLSTRLDSVGIGTALDQSVAASDPIPEEPATSQTNERKEDDRTNEKKEDDAIATSGPRVGFVPPVKPFTPIPAFTEPLVTMEPLPISIEPAWENSTLKIGKEGHALNYGLGPLTEAELSELSPEEFAIHMLSKGISDSDWNLANIVEEMRRDLSIIKRENQALKTSMNQILTHLNTMRKETTAQTEKMEQFSTLWLSALSKQSEFAYDANQRLLDEKNRTIAGQEDMLNKSDEIKERLSKIEISLSGLHNAAGAETAPAKRRVNVCRLEAYKKSMNVV